MVFNCSNELELSDGQSLDFFGFSGSSLIFRIPFHRHPCLSLSYNSNVIIPYNSMVRKYRRETPGTVFGILGVRSDNATVSQGWLTPDKSKPSTLIGDTNPGDTRTAIKKTSKGNVNNRFHNIHSYRGSVTTAVPAPVSIKIENFLLFSILLLWLLGL